ncbi:MBL fold metallo-hydrolase [Hahella sp. CCB-MM4]|uniref:MBL fold metallo-hydrolase RNA specificity domain-containing protein n=1 Tax=Hahella sp. (strain CCB-MM4) TaxID=1926491 RepID=UPI000B9B4DC1|nr:MBL fold metallo-hydrolase [Hahella sp. CCB-MM4]OZG71878.1 MBL fold metallo-hydrolase [Hahella sp. CCB-MM4]
MELSFLGAAGTVTGSKYLITHQDRRMMVDCGLYQGVKNLRERNWKSLPIAPKDIDCLLLTHAHLDHSGYIPALIKHGFKGKVFCTRATKSLARVLLPDSGFLQEEDARYANKRQFSKHKPALPLYTEKEAWKAIEHFETVDFHEDVNCLPGFKARFIPAGHILGASSIVLDSPAGKMVFSGDLGRPHDLIMKAPEAIEEADYLVLESTYGDRLHESIDIPTVLADIITSTAEQGGIVLIPAFAVGRAQALLHLIQELKKANRIPDLPVYLNSPMAITATEIFCHYHHLHRLTPEQCHDIDKGTHYVRTVEESIDLNRRKYPAIIVSASGMASGGRVLHHLKALLPDYRNSVVFAGFQAPGTRGDSLVNGAQQVKIHGQYYPVKASVHQLDALSAHADYSEILDWLENFSSPPKHTFVTHGEAPASDALRLRIKDELGWNVSVPEYLDKVTLPL